MRIAAQLCSRADRELACARSRRLTAALGFEGETRGKRAQSERVVEMMPPEVSSFEYRHTPDPREIDQILLPLLEEIRGALGTQNLAEPAAPLRRSHEN